MKTMTRLPVALLAAGFAMGLTACSTQSTQMSEVGGYAKNSLAYEALVTGDMKTAESQLTTSPAAAKADPAWQLNMAHVHAMKGETDTAIALYQAVMAQGRSFPVTLASGEVASTKEVAALALARLQAK